MRNKRKKNPYKEGAQNGMFKYAPGKSAAGLEAGKQRRNPPETKAIKDRGVLKNDARIDSLRASPRDKRELYCAMKRYGIEKGGY
jgi:hypothetical protein